jgi:hypothetical protein
MQVFWHGAVQICCTPIANGAKQGFYSESKTVGKLFQKM